MNNKITHLEMIEKVIERMAKNSFMLKGWTVGLSAALLTFAACMDSNPVYYFVPFVPVLIFWCLDGYYLYLEKKYRNLYNKVRYKKEDEIDFDMNHNNKEIRNSSIFFKSLFSLTECIFYISLIALLAIIIIVIKFIE